MDHITLSMLFGAFVGFALGLTGGGGSLLAVPLLVYGLAIAPREAFGGVGEYDYLAQMTALEAIDDSGQVEYFFECTTEPAHSSGWQSSSTYSVTVGWSGQNHRFRVKARDLYGNETAWSEELPAELAPRQPRP